MLYYNSSYHIAPLDFGEGGAIVLLSACFLALSRTRWGLGMVPLVHLMRLKMRVEIAEMFLKAFDYSYVNVLGGLK